MRCDGQRFAHRRRETSAALRHSAPPTLGHATSLLNSACSDPGHAGWPATCCTDRRRRGSGTDLRAHVPAVERRGRIPLPPASSATSQTIGNACQRNCSSSNQGSSGCRIGTSSTASDGNSSIRDRPCPTCITTGRSVNAVFFARPPRQRLEQLGELDMQRVAQDVGVDFLCGVRDLVLDASSTCSR